MESPNQWTAGYKLLGRQCDLRQFARACEFDVLDVHDSRWTMAINQAWMNAAIYHGEPIVELPSTPHRDTILEWERLMLRRAGYVRTGAVWMPPE
jgi:hypothetical protein